MSGVAIVGILLRGDSNLTAVVPAERIYSGVIPLEPDLPAISVREISGRQENNLGMNSANYLMETRVQVTIATKIGTGNAATDGYPAMKAILELVQEALPLSLGTVGTFTCQGILPELIGADIFDEQERLWMQSLDFMVSWTRSAT